MSVCLLVFCSLFLYCLFVYLYVFICLNVVVAVVLIYLRSTNHSCIFELTNLLHFFIIKFKPVQLHGVVEGGEKIEDVNTTKSKLLMKDNNIKMAGCVFKRLH